MSLASFFGGGGDTIGAEDVSGKTLATLFFGFDAKTGQCYCLLAHALLVASAHRVDQRRQDADFAVGGRSGVRAARRRSTTVAARAAISAPSARSTFRRTARSTPARFRPAAAARSSA